MEETDDDNSVPLFADNGLRHDEWVIRQDMNVAKICVPIPLCRDFISDFGDNTYEVTLALTFRETSRSVDVPSTRSVIKFYFSLMK